jgi:hypothetical protein
MNKGFVILAQNTKEVNYVRCAEALALSLKNSMPNCDITLLTDEKVKNKLFDKVIPLPYGDLAPFSNWKLINDWQVYEASPYEYTIKLEADMYIPKSIEHWWDILKHKDVVVSTTIRNFYQDVSDSRAYRKFIDNNNLPDVYNAITYFKKSDDAKKFFLIVRDVFENWSQYKNELKCLVDEPVSTDWAYALACHIIGVEKTTLPTFTDMSMVHMKQAINYLPTENWTDTLVYEILQDVIRVQTVPQLYPFHYHVKTFADKLIENIKWKKSKKGS